ncbi:Hypothetical protein FKW44_004636 [Caligus rogercresseyi]|uniref:Uncharacterized protein n=1 Tax=Caligus rogercresseyi TaxID=217165 RepID=A0A7T8HMF2_CALRO|nr:Hypothetical protein FKW44_004636 [Caligus rogercresseyi]
MVSYPSSDFVRELPIPRLRPRSSFLRLRHRVPRPSSPLMESCHSSDFVRELPIPRLC